MRKELFSPLRIYTAKEKKFVNRKFFNTDSIDYTLAAPKTKWLPWIFLRDPSVETVSSIKVMSNKTDTAVFTLSNQASIDSIVKIFQLRDSTTAVTDDLIFYNGDAVAGMNLDTGNYHLEIIDSSGAAVYTEDFCVVNDTCDFIRVSWLHSTDIDYFPYSQGFKHHAYIDSDLIEEEPKYQREEVPTGKGETEDVFHSVTKVYSLKTDLLPPYMLDAISLIPLHDTVTLSKPDLSLHIENSNLKNIDFEGEYKTKMAYDGVLKFRLETISRASNNENLNINPLILTESTFTLSNGFASQFDACNNVGTPSTATFYSEDSTLIIGSVIYSTQGDNTSIVASQWVRDSSNNRAMHTDSSGEIDQIFTCITEYQHNLVTGSFTDDAAACATLSGTTLYYSDDQTLVSGSILYEDSQDVSSVVSDGRYFDRSTDKVVLVSSGAVSGTPTLCSENQFGFLGTFANENVACEANGVETTYYTRDVSLIVGSVLYTTSHLNNSYLPSGWYYWPGGGRSVNIGANGVVSEIINCSSENSYTLVGPESTEAAVVASGASANTVYSLDSTINVGSFLYGTTGDQDSFVSDGWYEENASGDTMEVTSGQIVTYNPFAPE